MQQCVVLRKFTAFSLIFIGIIQLCDFAIHYDKETHLKNVWQLTFGGQNAEAYFSYDGNWITFQATGMETYGTDCDQIYRMDLRILPDQQVPHRMSTGIGVCTCSYFYPDNRHTIYSGTFQSAKFTSNETLSSCPQKMCHSDQARTDPVLKELCNTSYTWDVFPGYDIFKVNEFGSIVNQLTDFPGYDAEGAVSPDGQYIVFTSLRSGDLEIWIMNSDGSNPKQLTDELGYDGGPFFSPDGQKIIFRASHPKTEKDIRKYKSLLSYNLVSPLEMDLYVMNIDGSNLRKITSLGGSSWAPFYNPDNRRIIFSSNFNKTKFSSFDLYMIDESGENLERITYNEDGFDAFPMFDREGKRLIWASSRNGRSPYQLNIFIADWVNDVDTSTMISSKISDVSLNRKNMYYHVGWIDDHLKHSVQITHFDENFDSHFSFDDKMIVYCAKGSERYETQFNQIYVQDLKRLAEIPRRLSSGLGSNVMAYFFPNGDSLYSSTLLSCNRSFTVSSHSICFYSPEPYIREICGRNSVIELMDTYDIIRVNKFGNFIQRLTSTPGYDGDGKVSPDGSAITFTSMRSGDFEIWSMLSNGSNPKQLTSMRAYCGMPAFNYDGTKIVFQSYQPTTQMEWETYSHLRRFNLVDLVRSEIFVMSFNGSSIKQVTKLNTLSMSPTFLKTGRIVFSSNYGSHSENIFNLFTINEDGSDLLQLTEDETVNILPMESFHSERMTWTVKKTNRSNIFLAHWNSPESVDFSLQFR